MELTHSILDGSPITMKSSSTSEKMSSSPNIARSLDRCAMSSTMEFGFMSVLDTSGKGV